MEQRKYKLYLASGIKLWTLDFKDNYAPYLNKNVDVFYPALIDDQFCKNHRLIPIKIATKDLGEINNRDAVLAYMKTYDTEGNGPTGTDSSWECGYAIGKEKPTIMIVEDLGHLDYYAAQWMVTFSIGAILTTSKEVAEEAKNNDKFTHVAVLYCEDKNQFEDKIIGFLDNYYKSIYAREGLINYEVDVELRKIAETEFVSRFLKDCESSGENNDYHLIKPFFDEIFVKKNNYELKKTHKQVCQLEFKRAKVIKELIESNSEEVIPFLKSCVRECCRNFEKSPNLQEIAKMISYWLSIPCQEVKGHHQGKKKTRPMIFYELYDLVSHHINESDRYYSGNHVYKSGAIVEVYNWLNTYAIDDVFDNSDTRQGNDTLHIKYGSRKNAFLLGAIGHCMSLILAHEATKSNPEVSKEVMKALNDAQYLMYLGQPVDIDLSFENQKELHGFIRNHNLESALEMYFSRIYGICGAFYEEIGRMAVKSTNVGAQFYNQEEAEKDCVYIAKLFGLVQMIRNDLGDLIFPEEMSGMSKGMKSSSHNDVMEGKLTLPVLYSVFSKDTPEKDKRILIKCLGNRRLNLKDKLEVSRIIWESGSIEFCMQFIERYCELVSNRYINGISETPTRLRWILKLMDITTLINLSFRKLAIEKKWRKLEPAILQDDLLVKLDQMIDRVEFLKKYDIHEDVSDPLVQPVPV